MIREMSADRVGEWSGRIIDVRSPQEYAGERLARAENVPLPEIGRACSGWSKAEPLLVMCKAGVRSRQAAEQLVSAGFGEVTTLVGGIDACRKAGVPLVFVRKAIPIIRQVLIAAGGLLLIGLALGRLNSAWLLLDWVVAAGLVFAGVSGYCPMAWVMERMPWNKTGTCCSAASPVSKCAR